MANEKDKKKTTTRAPAKKTSASTKAKTQTKKAASSSGHSSKNKTSKTATGSTKNPPQSKQKQTPKKQTPAQIREEQAKQARQKEEQKAKTAAKRKTFSEQYMPYILGALGILMLAFFATYLIGDMADPDEYWMGPWGYYFSYFFYGLFGWTAFCLPILLVYLAAFWRKNCREDTVVLRTTLSVVFMILLASVVHVFACHANDSLADIDVALFYESGALLEGGGVIGGLLGSLLYNGLKLWGTILVSVLVFPLLIMFIIGVTPAYVGSWIKARMADSKENREAKKAVAVQKPAASKPVKPVKEKKWLKEAPMDDDEDAAYVPPKAARKAYASADPDEGKYGDEDAPRRTVRVDARTGEVLDDVDEAPVKRRPESESVVTEQPEEMELEDVTAPPESTEETAEQIPEEVEETTAAVEEAQPESSEEAQPESDGEAASTNATDNEEELTLYIPNRDAYGHRKGHKKPKASAAQDAAASNQREDDFFAVDDLPEEMESMEITWDDDEEEVSVTAAETVSASPEASLPPDDDEALDDTAVTANDAPEGAKEPERFVVVVNRQETAAVTSTTDNHVDGLPDEEIVLPSSAGEEISEEEKREYAYPPLELLIPGPSRYEADEDEIVRNTQTLRNVLESFHIRVKEIACSCGPTITRYEVKPDTGVRVRSIANLVDDIALGLAKSGVRIEAPIPGKAAVGIEVPNDHASTVALRNLIEAPEFMNHKSRLAACLGADVAGRPVMMDINKMPHLLVAGTTGSGKSVCINSIIMSILYKAKPDEVKLILIDPKKVEFAVYRDLPHLYCPLISDPKKAAGALNSAVVEMERRFELIEEVGVRNIAGYNEATAGDPERPPLPQMVIIIDELADLMMTASNEVETAICRLAQKARAAGIHLILGTQRPSVDVITGLIKANVPSRIAFTVSAAVDSRTIIDTVGAEKLIGRGDMLYSPVGSTKPMRVQGTFVSDGEVEKVVTFLKEHNAQIEYDESFMHMIEVEAAKCGQGKKKGGDVGNIEDFSALGGDDEDGKFWAAVEVAVDAEKISTSLLQRRLNLGYGRAAKIIDRMEEMGFVGPADGNKPRKLLITKSDLAEIRISGRVDGGGV